MKHNDIKYSEFETASSLREYWTLHPGLTRQHLT